MKMGLNLRSHYLCIHYFLCRCSWYKLVEWDMSFYSSLFSYVGVLCIHYFLMSFYSSIF